MTRGSTKTAGVGVVALWLAVALLLVILVHEAAAVECNDPSQLSSPCTGSIFGSQTPSTECCEKLREQALLLYTPQKPFLQYLYPLCSRTEACSSL
ncbi:Bifunctional inhibitor/lipid-transfer protein/seed storage 2S albumin superfamily protein [Striga hermonthica]|uniref:Bifunctional inhibitor/lipid-transfer protein/seed storage 2S albumin superfamily protein n=1 Tax=Striga hermonthica TaxID=68872 RepID=A0A9N7R9J8_STRHE|nr:Bifunctional inhibitor/lipid-transfer protein/seed storage 2S albumin superfamily protein [Striga hermonthica]